MTDSDDAPRRRGGYISDPEPRGVYGDQPPVPRADGGDAPTQDIVVRMSETEAAKTQVAIGALADDDEVSEQFADDLEAIGNRIARARYTSGKQTTVDTEALATVVEWATEMVSTFEPHQMDDHVVDAISELDDTLGE